MARYAIIDKNTNIVLNVIEADAEFINSMNYFVHGSGQKINKQDCIVLQSDEANPGDIVIDGEVQRVKENKE